MKRVLLLYCLLSISVAKVFPQARLENRNNFFQAENYVLYEEYKEALPLYQGLLRIEPNNANFKYRTGQCLINIQGRKAEAIRFLEDAVKNINLKYKEGRYKETKAPYDAYYYLANAYRVNNQLPKAIETYELFKKNLDPKVYDTAIVNLQIESCRNAMELMKLPIFIKKENLGDIINGRFSDYNPVVSADESVMVFNKAEQFQDIVYFTKKVNGKWTAPIDIIPDFGLGFEEKNYVTSISDDGREIYVYRPGADYDGNIYVSKRDKNDKWSNLIKLNDNINTKYWESHATISHSGKKLYFTSNRKGTYGGLDIWVSQKDSTGDWGPAKNLGPVVNTVYNEESPFLGKDDKTLFFSSRGHFNIGGYDIFYTTMMDNGEWSVPLNVGYPINSTDDDVFFYPVHDGYQAYYAMDIPAGNGLQDIYRIEIFSKDHPRKFFVKGIVKVRDLLSVFKDSVKVSALNLEDPNATVIVYSNPLTGEYKFELPQGKYELKYEADGAQKSIQNIDLPITQPTDSFVLPGTTLPKTDFVADLTVESNKTLSVAKNDTIAFPIKVEPKSVLTIEHWLGDSLITSENVIITDSLFVYKMVPRTGDNRIVFKLTDKFSNTTSSDVFVKLEKVITSQPLVRPEYSRVIALKQTTAFINMLRNRADDKLKKVIQRSRLEKQQYGRVDDIISNLKEEAAKSSISPDAVDKSALKVAVMDNVLTQSAVDLVAHNTQGELKNILSNLNIYNAGLKTWTDLQKYVSEKSNGKIQPVDLNKIAADILADIDTSIAKAREKILAYSDKYVKGTLIKQSVSATDNKNIKNGGKWLQSIYNESLTAGITNSEMADMLSILSSLPGTEAGKYLEDLASYSDDGLKIYLTGNDLKKVKFKTSNDIVLYLLKNKTKGSYSEISLYKALIDLISAKDIPTDVIESQIVKPESNNLWIVWVLLGTGLIIFFFVFKRDKKKKKK
jgi:hypothetical protein